MQDLIDRMLIAVWGTWRFRWLALLLAWVVTVAGWIVIDRMPYQFEAKARIYVDTNRVLGPLLTGIAVQPDVKAQVAMMSKALLTRPNLEKLIRLAELDLAVANQRESEILLDELKNRIALWGGKRNDSIYNVSYTHEDPVVAKRVVQSLINIFIESTLGEERQDSNSAQSFLDKQIADYDARLVEAENRLSEFKRENAGSMPDESGGYYQRLQIAQAQQRAVSLELGEARNRRSALAQQIANERAVVLDGEAGMLTVDPRLISAREQLDDLLVRYTDRHPQVSQLRDTIATLEQAQRDAAASGRALGANAQREASLFFQQIRTLLAEADARVAELQVRVADSDRQVSELEDKVDSLPLVEAQLLQLDRDYETIKAQHQTLLQRLESARISEQLEQNADDVKFRVIDPPFVPSTPNSPNKQLLTLGALVAAIACGAGLAFLMSLLWPVFHNQRSLHDFSGLPVLGCVALSTSRMAKLRGLSWTVLYTLLLTLLLIAYAGIWYLQNSGSSLLELLNSEVLSRSSSSEVQAILSKLMQLPGVSHLIQWTQSKQ